MNIAVAIEIIEAKRAEYGLGFLEMLKEMEVMRADDALSERELIAFRVFMREGAKLFA